ncbi:MAG: helix-turn-helix transcriptional regulator [Bacteroidota bacterium]
MSDQVVVRIKEYITSQGMTLIYVAGVTGFDYSHLSRQMRKGKISGDFIIAFANVFPGADMNKIMRGEPAE